MSTLVANGVEPGGRLVAGGSKRVNKLDDIARAKKYRALSLEFINSQIYESATEFLPCSYRIFMPWASRGPSADFTTRHSIRKLSIVMALSTTFTQFPPETTKFRKITLNNGHFAVQGHSRSPILVPIESSYTTSY